MNRSEIFEPVKVVNQSGSLQMTLSILADGHGAIAIRVHEKGKRTDQVVWLSMTDYLCLKKAINDTDALISALSNKRRLKWARFD